MRTKPTTAVWIRVNNRPNLIRDDIEAVVGPNIAGIVIPKVESRADLEMPAALIGELEERRGLSPGSIRLMALIETAGTVLAVADIIDAPRVDRIVLDEADLAAELGLDLSDDEHELAPFRMQMVLACAAARIDPPVGPVLIDFRDLDALRVSTVALRRMGFLSRQAIHPAQVPVINDVFTPRAEHVEAARQLLATAESTPGGVFVDTEGRFVDEAILRSARRIVELSDRD